MKTDHTYRFLVADDDAISRLLMQTLLRQISPEVAAVANGEEALLAVAEHTYDIVFMDVHMPVMSGIDAMLAMKSALPADRLPVVVALTGSSDDETLRRCLEVGMVDALVKPVDMGQLRLWLDEYERTRDSYIADSSGLLNMARIRELKDLEQSAATEAVIAELISLFQTECPTQIAELKTALTERDRERTMHLSHKIKGSLLNLGLHAAADVCAQIENVSDAEDMGIFLQLIDRLEHVYTRSYAEFSQYLRPA